ncbi:TetR family transcriptional regulator [Flavobacterium lutivivi]|nr:TetR family transcriptional regulator [Flavobacterium lutivivi]
MSLFNEKQIEIIIAAERLFAEEGFDGTSVRDIAKAANVNIAMISYYFGSKEKLLEALLLYRVSSMKLTLESVSQENISPVEKMNKLIYTYVNRIHSNRCIYQILHFELSNKKRELNFKEFIQLKKENLKFIEAIVKEGQEKGFYSNDINIALLPTIIIGSYIHFHMNKVYYIDLLLLDTEEKYEKYIQETLTPYIQKTINALLTHEK